MNSKSLRRLATDHAQLHASLPPNYLFPPTNASDDLSTLTILLAGPDGTPYSSGLFTLTLHIPATYPTAPPTAAFKTRIWHPNVEESTGKVCVETLKRDWDASLRLYDVLVTISCLLIQPNPASALNADAGMALERGWAGFERRARMMTGIHAPVPRELVEGVREAKARGEAAASADVDEKDARRKRKGKAALVRMEEMGGEEENVQRGEREKGGVRGVESGKAPVEPLSQAPENVLGISGIKATDSGCDLRSSFEGDKALLQTSRKQVPESTSVTPGPVAATTTTTIVSPITEAMVSITPVKIPPPQLHILTPSGDPLPEPLYLSWYKGLMTEKTPERVAREKAEHRRLKAAGWDLDLYNRGVVGGIREKRGLKRL